MVEVGVRELKARLSYYLQLVQAGEDIAVKVRDQVVGFFSARRPPSTHKSRFPSRRDLQKKFDRFKAKGFVVSGGPYRNIPVKPIQLKGGVISTTILRALRDEGP